MDKRLMGEQIFKCREHPGEINIASLASFAYSSEAADCPLKHLIDGCDGPGGTRWTSARANTAECIVLEFDSAQRLSRLVYEAEEHAQERTQEVRVEVSTDKGETYRQVLAQDYTFSPRGATFQHEELQLDLNGVTHLKLTIVPNKGGSGVATLTSLQLFGPASAQSQDVEKEQNQPLRPHKPRAQSPQQPDDSPEPQFGQDRKRASENPPAG